MEYKGKLHTILKVAQGLASGALRGRIYNNQYPEAVNFLFAIGVIPQSKRGHEVYTTYSGRTISGKKHPRPVRYLKYIGATPREDT